MARSVQGLYYSELSLGFIVPGIRASKKLTVMIRIAIPVFIVHSVEEFLADDVDSGYKFVAEYGRFFLSEYEDYLVAQSSLWLVVLFGSFYFARRKWFGWGVRIFGIVFIIETHHIVKAAYLWNYEPGLITGVLLVVLGLVFWLEALTSFDAV